MTTELQFLQTENKLLKQKIEVLTAGYIEVDRIFKDALAKLQALETSKASQTVETKASNITEPEPEETTENTAIAPTDDIDDSDVEFDSEEEEDITFDDSDDDVSFKPDLEDSSDEDVSFDTDSDDEEDIIFDDSDEGDVSFDPDSGDSSDDAEDEEFDLDDDEDF